MATDEKYAVLNRDNLLIPIQMQLFQKQKTFSELFAGFSKSGWHFERVKQKDNSDRFSVSEIIDSEYAVR